MKRIGWALDTSSKRLFPLPWDELSPVGRIRYGGIAQWLKRVPGWQHEKFKPWKRYEAVVFVKVMGDHAKEAAEKLRRKGTKVIFDANVNYYEEWGDFRVPGTRPTLKQKSQALCMTQMADAVVADSTYLEQLCQKINPKTFCIPDAVDTDFFTRKASPPNEKLTFIWSGIGKKAYHLELIEPILKRFRDRIRLILIPSPPKPYDPPAAVLARLHSSFDSKMDYFQYEKYPAWLHQADVILSPKDLGCSYEMSHTEYKITLGMAAGLPALAGPQPSYLEAIGDGIGGTICRTDFDWSNAIERYLQNPQLLRPEGELARKRVLDRYSIEVVARSYLQVLEQVCSS